MPLYVEGLSLLKAACSVRGFLFQSQEHEECLMIKVTWENTLVDRQQWLGETAPVVCVQYAC